MTDHTSPPSPCAVRVEPIAMHRDPRGSVLEPLDATELPAQRNVHVVISEPGAIRGNHLHRRATEICLVYGPALMRLREDGVLRDVEVPAGEAWRFVIPPGTPHAILNTGPGPGITVAFSTEEQGAADTVREVVMEAAGGRLPAAGEGV